MTNNLKERYAATLVGCGYGDTLGMAVEGWKKAQIEKYTGGVRKPIAPILIKNVDETLKTEDEFGKLKYYTRDLSQGDVTDDTILTIPIAESIIEKKFLDLDDICLRQVQEYISRLMPNGHVFGGFGRTTKDAFENIIKGISSKESGVFPGLGTGPCMKMAPVGLYMHSTGSYDEGIRVSRLIGRSTHLDERAITTGVVQADLIYHLLNENFSRHNFLTYLNLAAIFHQRENPKGFPKEEKGYLSYKVNWIIKNQNTTDAEAKKFLGNSSLAIEAYPFTLFMFQKYWDKPLEGLIETVNWGGDCDTTGAMYGALAGAKNGMIFPETWKLNEKQKLINLGEKLWEMKHD